MHIVYVLCYSMKARFSAPKELKSLANTCVTYKGEQQAIFENKKGNNDNIIKGKTGTKSIAKALCHLGFIVFDWEEQIFYFMDHWVDVFQNGT